MEVQQSHWEDGLDIDGRHRRQRRHCRYVVMSLLSLLSLCVVVCRYSVTPAQGCVVIVVTCRYVVIVVLPSCHHCRFCRRRRHVSSRVVTCRYVSLCVVIVVIVVMSLLFLLPL